MFFGLFLKIIASKVIIVYQAILFTIATAIIIIAIALTEIVIEEVAIWDRFKNSLQLWFLDRFSSKILKKQQYLQIQDQTPFSYLKNIC